jgi:FG-GAP repeat
MASGDFDGDGYADLAVGLPNEDVGAAAEDRYDESDRFPHALG